MIGMILRATLGAPAIAAAGLSLVWLVQAAVGEHPMWRHEPLTLAEAAALREPSEVVRQIAGGENPNLPRSIRGGFLDQDDVTLTPMVAAVRAGRPEVVQVLLEGGVVVTPPLWTRLWCLADEETVRELLGRVRPVSATADCASQEE